MLPPNLTLLSVKGMSVHPRVLATLPNSITDLAINTSVDNNVACFSFPISVHLKASPVGEEVASISLPHLKTINMSGNMTIGQLQRNSSFYSPIKRWRTYPRPIGENIPNWNMFSNLTMLTVPELDESEFCNLSRRLRKICISKVIIHDVYGSAFKTLPPDLNILWIENEISLYEPSAVSYLPKFIEKMIFPVTRIDEDYWCDYPTMLKALSIFSSNLSNGQRYVTNKVFSGPPRLKSVLLFAPHLKTATYFLRDGLAHVEVAMNSEFKN
jgi:hypothetical protein